MTPQQHMKATLTQANIPYKAIEVYGSQIVVTTWSYDAAVKWGVLLATFATIRKVALKSIDYAKENKGTCLRPTTLEVYRTYARI